MKGFTLNFGENTNDATGQQRRQLGIEHEWWADELLRWDTGSLSGLLFEWGFAPNLTVDTFRARLRELDAPSQWLARSGDGKVYRFTEGGQPSLCKVRRSGTRRFDLYYAD